MIERGYYIGLIEEIRNIEKISIENFINEKLKPLMLEDDHFIETLYKDINYLLKDIDKKDENDLLVKNGDLVVENGEIQLTGYQSRLHLIANWLHMQMIEKFTTKNDPMSFVDKMKNFEEYYLNKQNYTPEYKEKLDKIKKSLTEERMQNLNKKPTFEKRIINWIKKKRKKIVRIGGILTLIITILSFLQQITGYTLKDAFNNEIKFEDLSKNKIIESDSLVISDKKNVVEKVSKEVFENYYKTILYCTKNYATISAFSYIQNYSQEEINKINKRILNKSYINRYAVYNKYWTKADYEDVSKILRTRTIIRINEIFEDIENQTQGPFVLTEDKLKLLQEMVEKEIGK